MYNLWKRSLGQRSFESNFTKASTTLFQQRWLSKKLLRAYHGDYINEDIFKRWYLPAMLPDVRDRVKETTANLLNYAGRQDALDKVNRLRAEDERQAHAPVGSLMWAEVERRIDTVIFRACLSHSIYAARELVIHRHVKLNGKIVRLLSSPSVLCLTREDQHNNPNTRLAPGDMVTVNPDAIQMLSAGKPIQKRWRSTSWNTPPLPPARVPKPEPKPKREAEVKAEESAENANENANETDGQPQDGAEVTLHDADSKPDTLRTAREFKLPEFSGPFIFVPAYLEVSYPTCSVIYVRAPTARAGYSEIPTPYDADGEVMRLAWEWYAQRRPRMRSKKKLAGMPDNRQGQWVFQGIDRSFVPPSATDAA